MTVRGSAGTTAADSCIYAILLLSRLRLILGSLTPGDDLILVLMEFGVGGSLEVHARIRRLHLQGLRPTATSAPHTHIPLFWRDHDDISNCKGEPTKPWRVGVYMRCNGPTKYRGGVTTVRC
jgi:hypothetical protein